MKTPVSPRIRKIIFIGELVFVAALFVIYFSSQSLQSSRHLWVLFLYSIPGNFLIDVIPYDPAVIFFARFHAPLIIAFVGVAGIMASEAINYTCFEYIVDRKFFDKILKHKFVVKLTRLFNKAPFWTMLIVAFTPIPIYPFRFLVVLARFPLLKYLLALFVGRLPRLYLIALFGHFVVLPGWAYLVIFIALSLIMYLPLVKLIPQKKQKEKMP
ncbi:MAG: VTT domain-containing protein [Candidatus Aminicenantes bacterium]|nr:VTT domain-containing protein [Candidatus Aminicenantes bacterium]